MWSILVAGAAQILHVSRILHDTGTRTHYRGPRDDGMPGHLGRDSTYDGPRLAGPAGACWGMVGGNWRCRCEGTRGGRGQDRLGGLGVGGAAGGGSRRAIRWTSMPDA